MIDRNKIRNIPRLGQPLGYHSGPCKLVERTTVAFDDAVAYLVQVDVLQDNGTAISTFERESPAGANRAPAGDL
jgi:hypothetical protein